MTPTTMSPTGTTPTTSHPVARRAASLNTARVASSIKESITIGRGIDVTVSCPPYVPTEVGRTFTCTATAANGKTTIFSVTIEDRGGGVRFTSE